MKIGSTTMLRNVTRAWADFRGTNLSHQAIGEEAPLRAELFSASQMVRHGKALAGSHTLSPGHHPERLLARLAENEHVLFEVRDLLTEAVKTNRRITQAEEWLLDNFYLIEEEYRVSRINRSLHSNHL